MSRDASTGAHGKLDQLPGSFHCCLLTAQSPLACTITAGAPSSPTLPIPFPASWLGLCLTHSLPNSRERDKDRKPDWPRPGPISLDQRSLSTKIPVTPPPGMEGRGGGWRGDTPEKEEKGYFISGGQELLGQPPCHLILLESLGGGGREEEPEEKTSFHCSSTG